MRPTWAILVLALAAPAAAQVGQPLRGDEISGLLTLRNPAGAVPPGTALVFAGATQIWEEDGSTVESRHDGSLVEGEWRVEEDQYCDRWPPEEAWTCHEVYQDGASVRFVSPDGDERVGVIGE